MPALLRHCAQPFADCLHLLHPNVTPGGMLIALAFALALAFGAASVLGAACRLGDAFGVGAAAAFTLAFALALGKELLAGLLRAC